MRLLLVPFLEKREWEVHFRNGNEKDNVEWINTLILGERIDKNKIK